MQLLLNVLLDEDEKEKIGVYKLAFGELRELGLVREDADGNMGRSDYLLRCSKRLT